VVFVLLILIYVTIMAIRLGRMERQLVELSHDLARREEAGEADRDPDENGLPDSGREPARVSAGAPVGDSSL
jgi:hypothetical protein